MLGELHMLRNNNILRAQCCNMSDDNSFIRYRNWTNCWQEEPSTSQISPRPQTSPMLQTSPRPQTSPMPQTSPTPQTPPTPPGVNAGAIIFYASGAIPVVLTTTDSGESDTVSAITLGDSISGLSIVDGRIVLPVNNPPLPRNGTISSIFTQFITTEDLDLGLGVGFITARLFTADSTSNVYTELTDAAVTLSPSLTENNPAGTTVAGNTTGLSISVEAGTRLLVVFEITAPGVTEALTVNGEASAGLSIL